MKTRLAWRILLVLVLALISVGPVAGQTVDPRTANARSYQLDAAGRVVGVELVYDERPTTDYQLVQARLIDEASAGGNTVAKFTVVDCFGTPISEDVFLAWPWPAMNHGKLLPGNQNSEHMIMSPYTPPDIGALAIFVGDAAGRINSDVIGGLGLPNKRHVSYYLAFRKRCSVSPTPTMTPTPRPATSTPVAGPTPTPIPGGGGDLSETNGLLRQILDVLQGLARHLGFAPGYAPSY